MEMALAECGEMECDIKGPGREKEERGRQRGKKRVTSFESLSECR